VAETPEQRGGDAAGPRASAAISAPDYIIGFDALYESMLKCRAGVMWKDSVAHFVMNGVEEVMKLERQLGDGSYRPRPPMTFTITHPKRREIVSISFRDRIYQRSLNDNSIYPQMTRSFIYDNAACQTGKGTDFARGRLKCFMQRQWRKTGCDAWVLQLDISGYYPNMRHDAVRRKFERQLDPESFRMAMEVFDSQYPGDVGFNPGSQMVQIAGISLLDDIDHAIKERLHMKHYVRYMDDLIIVNGDRQALVDAMAFIEDQLAEIGFVLNPKKSRIYHMSCGIPFLGFDFRITETGKVIMCLKSENVKHERRKLKKLVRLGARGAITRETVDECYQGWRAHAMHGNNHRLVMRMDEYYKNLWKEQTC